MNEINDLNVLINEFIYNVLRQINEQKKEEELQSAYI